MEKNDIFDVFVHDENYKFGMKQMRLPITWQSNGMLHEHMCQ